MSVPARPHGCRWLAVAAVVFLTAGGIAMAQPRGGGGGRMGGGGFHGGMGGLHGGPHQHFDGRFSHDRYYFNRGYSVHVPPPGGRELYGPHGGRYWYRGGNWYRWRGGNWVVWGAPLGLFVPFLPPYYTTIWWGGIPYYYANDTYYLWDDSQNGYEVVSPPPAIDTSGSTQPPASNKLFIYPKNGQSPQQQGKDQYECHRWAVQQSGFDPTVSGGGVPADQNAEKRDHYFRADVACLQGRGYAVD